LFLLSLNYDFNYKNRRFLVDISLIKSIGEFSQINK